MAVLVVYWWFEFLVRMIPPYLTRGVFGTSGPWRIVFILFEVVVFVWFLAKQNSDAARFGFYVASFINGVILLFLGYVFVRFLITFDV